MDGIFADFKYAFRSLTKSPAFSAIAIATIALGIGANTAIFSIVNATLIRPLPFRDSNRVVMLWQTLPARGRFQVPASPSVYLYWKERTRGVFEQVSDIDGESFNYTAGEFPERLWAAKVPSDFFQTLGATPVLGRTFTDDEMAPGRDKVVVLSHATWERLFHSDANIAGTSMELDGASWTVVGVMPSSVGVGRDALGIADMWVPERIQPDPANHFLKVVARLAPRVTLAQASSRLDAVSTQMAIDMGSNQAFGARIIPLRDELVGKARASLWILLGAVGLVLMMVCANIANLLVARGTNRRKEIGIRLALGAGRARIIRGLLVESMLMAAAGGTIGLMLSFWGVDALRKLAPANLSLAEYAGVDSRVLLFAILASIFTSLVFGLFPAVAVSKVELAESLNESGRALAGGGHRRLTGALVAGQVSIALVLLIGAGLLIHSFVKLQSISPGFDAHNLLIAQITLSDSKYKDKTAAAGFFSESLEKIRALPGVKSASISDPAPMTGEAWVTTLSPVGSQASERDLGWNADGCTAGLDYFRTIGIPIIRGRTFGESEMDGSKNVIVINETLAHRFFGDTDPIGKQLAFGHGGKPLEIIGVVGDVKQASLTEEAKSEFYIPSSPSKGNSVYLEVRTDSPSLPLAQGIKEAIASVDKNLPLYNVKTMDQIVSRSLSEQRFVTVVLGLFGAQALILSQVGIYGVASYFVNQRTREIGVRMALGARASDVVKMVMVRAAAQIAAGLLVGIAASIELNRLLRDLLYNIDRTDPYTYAAVTLALALAALAASFIPARRATRVDPMIALKTE